MGSVGKQLASNPIFISHFGLMGGHDAMDDFKTAPVKRAHKVEQQLSKGEWIFAPHKDVVVPGFVRAGTPRKVRPGCTTA